MTARTEHCRWPPVLLAATLLITHGTVATGDSRDAIAEHIEAGRYTAAYKASLHNDKPRPSELAHVARLVLDAGMRSSDSYPRWFALRATRTLDDPALAASARRLADSGDRYVRSLALEILAKTDLEGSRQDFLAALASPFRSVRLRALKALEELRDPELVGSFTDTLADDPDPDLRALAARALGTSGAKKAIPALREALDDPIAVVQEESVRSLVSLRDPKITELLSQRLAKAAPTQLTLAIRLAALVPDIKLLEDLGPFLGDENPEVRSFAAAAVLSIAQRTMKKNQ